MGSTATKDRPGTNLYIYFLFFFFLLSPLQSKPEQYIVLNKAKVRVSLCTEYSSIILLLIVMGDITKKKSTGDEQVKSFVMFSVIEVHFNNYQTGDGD